jgi:hypothetical protein
LIVALTSFVLVTLSRFTKDAEVMSVGWVEVFFAVTTNGV